MFQGHLPRVIYHQIYKYKKIKCVGQATPPLVPSRIDRETEFLIDNLLFRNHFVIVMIRWASLAPWEFESPFPGSLISIDLLRTSMDVQHMSIDVTLRISDRPLYLFRSALSTFSAHQLTAEHADWLIASTVDLYHPPTAGGDIRFY